MSPRAPEDFIRRTASTPAMAAAAAKNIAKKFASYAHAKPRLNKDTSAIMVSSRTLASNPAPPLCLCRTITSNKIDHDGGEHACLDGTGRRICLARTMIWASPDFKRPRGPYMLTRRFAVLGCCSVLASWVVAWAQSSYPSRVIHFVVPFAAGAPESSGPNYGATTPISNGAICYR